MVVDASVFIAAFRDEERTPIAQRVLKATPNITAPSIVLAEIANGLWSATRTAPDRHHLIRDYLTAAVRQMTLVPIETIVAEAFEIAGRLDHAVYDALYVALAQRESLAVVTLDERLVRKIRGTEYERFVTSAQTYVSQTQ